MNIKDLEYSNGVYMTDEPMQWLKTNEPSKTTAKDQSNNENGLYHWGFNNDPRTTEQKPAKQIEIEPEWALWAFAKKYYTAGGMMYMEADNMTVMRIFWVAFSLLSIPFEVYHPNEEDEFYALFEVRIQGVKHKSPVLYAIWNKLQEDTLEKGAVNMAFKHFINEHSDKVPFKTFQAYRNLLFHFSFECELKRQNLSFEYLFNNEEAWGEYLHSLELSDRTIRRYVKARKAFIDWCKANNIGKCVTKAA